MQRVEAAQEPGNPEDRTDRAAPAEDAPAYEPPRLIRVGSLRNLLGKTGFVADKGPPFELRE